MIVHLYLSLETKSERMALYLVLLKKTSVYKHIKIVFRWLFNPSSTKKLMIGNETNLPLLFFFYVRESINIELFFYY